MKVDTVIFNHINTYEIIGIHSLMGALTLIEVSESNFDSNLLSSWGLGKNLGITKWIVKTCSGTRLILQVGSKEIKEIARDDAWGDKAENHSEKGYGCWCSTTCVVVDFALSSNNWFEVVEEASAMGRVIALGDATSCNCSVLDGIHGS